MPKPNGPSRDLLFGLLALQNGLIDQGALFAAFAAWTRDKSRLLADHLVSLGHLDAARRAAVEAIAGVHIQTHGGDIEKSLAAVPDGRFNAPAWRKREVPTSTPPWGTSAPRIRRRTRTLTMTPSVPQASPWARPLPRVSGFASCGRMPRAAWGRFLWRSMASSTERSRSSRSSSGMPMIRSAGSDSLPRRRSPGVWSTRASSRAVRALLPGGARLAAL